MPEPAEETRNADAPAGRRAAPWRSWLLVGAAVVLLGGGSVYVAVSHRRGGPAGATSVTMSHVNYQSLVVGPVSYLDLRHAYVGKVIVLDYMASGCAACGAQIPKLVATYDRLRHQGVQFVGVSLETSRARTRAMIARLGIDYPVYLDSDGSAAAKRFAVHSLPATLVFGHGRLLKRFDGGASASDLPAYLTSHLAALTGNPHD